MDTRGHLWLGSIERANYRSEDGGNGKGRSMRLEVCSD